MKTTFSRNLAKKKVMSTDGMVIGTIKNVMVDMETGAADSLVVKPETSFDTSGYEMEGDRICIPFESVRDIRDYIVVDRYLLKQ